MQTDRPYELVFFDSAGTNHVPPYRRHHATVEDARRNAERIYPKVTNRAAHTPLIYGPGLPNDGVLALGEHRG